MLKKKITAFILSAMAVLQMIIPVNAAKVGFEDFDMAFEILQYAGVINHNPDTEFDTEKIVTRAEFSEMVGRMLNVTPYFETQYFDDVPYLLEQAGYINVLTDLGIISYNSEKIFDPERAVRYAEACKMLLCALGYGDYALLKGAPMSTYITVAAEAEFAVSVQNQEQLSQKEALTLIFKAMNAPVMKTNSGEVFVDDETNIFAEYHDIYFDKGVVYATDSAYMERYSLQEKGQAVVNDELFLTETDLSDYLATEIFYAYKYDSSYGEGTIFYAKAFDEDDSLTISAGLAESFDDVSNTLSYYKNETSNKLEKETLSKNMQVIYNGAPYDKSPKSLIAQFISGERNGYVRLADSDSDNKFDVLIIKSYEVLPSATIDANNEKIYGSYDKNVISYHDYKTVRYFDNFGNEKELINAQDAVLNVAKSEKTEILEIIVSNNTGVLEIESVMAEENKIKAKDANTYNVDARVMSQYKDLLFSYKSIKVYFDNFGYIVKLEPEAKGELVTGYLINGRYFENDEGAYEIQMNVYTKDKKIVRFKLSERVEIDEISYNMSKNSKAAISAIPNNWENGKIISISPQVIRYKVNEAGDIVKLDTENLTASEDANNSLVLRHKGASMLNSNRVGLDTYWAADKTDVFTVPALNSEGLVKKNGVYSEPKVSDFSTSVSLSFDESYTVDTYNYSDVDYYVGVMVVVKEQTTKINDVLVFTGTSKIWDESEEKALTVVECYSGGSKTSYKLNEGVEATLKNFKYGDLFYIMLDGSGACGTEIKKIFDTETMKFVHTSDNDYWYYGSYSPYSNWSYRTGENNRNNLSRMYVLKKRNGAIFGSYEFSGLADGKYEEIMKIGSLPVVIIDRENKNVEKGSFESILSYEEVGESAPLTLVESKTQVAKSVIIYK